MKKLLALVLALLMLLSVFCGSSFAEEDVWGIEDGAKLTVWLRSAFTSEADASWKAHWEEVAKEAGIDAEIVMVNGADVVETYNAALESGNIPDIMYMTTSICSGFIDNDQLLPLNGMIEKIETLNDKHFFDEMLDYWTFDGDILAVPTTVESRVLIYRKDMLAEAGYDHAPETWEELREIAKACTDAEKGIYGFGEPFGTCYDCTTNQTQSMLWAWDSTEIDENGNVCINNENTLDLINFLYEMYAVDGSIPPSAIGWDDSGNNTAYLSGQVAMIANIPTVITALQSAGLDDILENTGMAVLPAGPNGTVTCSSATQNMAIWSGTKYPNAAQYLLASYYDYEWYNDWMVNVSPVWGPVFAEMNAEPFWNEGMNAANMKAAEVGHAANWPVPTVDLNYSAYSANFAWGVMIQEVMEGKDPQQALNEMEATMLEYFK